MEPIYMPKSEACDRSKIIFTQDFFASALHEVAHWCVAGEERRKRVDFGYWYEPDGRSVIQQAEFERVEVKPQALEWLFTEAVGSGFRVSADNLAQGLDASDSFKSNVARQARAYCINGLPERPARFVEGLQARYGRPDSLSPSLYSASRL